MVMEKESEPVKTIMLGHLQELMEDSEVYGWKAVRAYHAAWLQFFEQGWVSWGDEKKLKLGRPLVWHRVILTSAVVSVPPPQRRQHPQTALGNDTYSQPSKPSDRDCLGFNNGICIES